MAAIKRKRIEENTRTSDKKSWEQIRLKKFKEMAKL
jgi:hypothetical protein